MKYFLFYLSLGILAKLLYVFHPLWLAQGLWICIAITLLIIAKIDWQTKEIPDKYNLFICFLAFLSLEQQSVALLWSHISGALILSLPLLLVAFLSKGGIGGGDIKLLAGMGLYLGLTSILLAFLLGSIAASFYGIYLILTKQATRKSTIALGPFLVFGMLLTMLWGDVLLSWYISLL